jgi:hypothetical protein
MSTMRRRERARALCTLTTYADRSSCAVRVLSRAVDEMLDCTVRGRARGSTQQAARECTARNTHIPLTHTSSFPPLSARREAYSVVKQRRSSEQRLQAQRPQQRRCHARKRTPRQFRFRNASPCLLLLLVLFLLLFLLFLLLRASRLLRRCPRENSGLDAYCSCAVSVCQSVCLSVTDCALFFPKNGMV